MKTTPTRRAAAVNLRALAVYLLGLTGVLLAFFALAGPPRSSAHSAIVETREVRPLGEDDEPERALPGGGKPESEAEDLLRLEEYRHNRLAYPTGRFNPAWVRQAADQHNANRRGKPGGKTSFAGSTFGNTATFNGADAASNRDATDFSALAVGPLALTPTSFTSLGPKPENMTGCGSTCFDYGVTAGRINTIAMDPTTTTNGSIVAYAGSDGGGVWKTTNCCSSATTWTVTTDDPLISSIAIASITIDPNNHNVIYAGTGDGDGGGSPSGSSQGILKSTDGGATWVVLAPEVFGAAYATPVGNFPQADSVTKVRVDPNNSSKVVAATKRGLFFSYDAGNNWTGPCTTNNFASQRQEVTSLELSNMGGGLTRILAAVGVRGFGVSVRPDLANNGANGIYKANMAASGCPSFTSTASNANGFKFGTAVTGSPYTTGANLNAGTGVAYVSTSTGNQFSRIDIGVAPSNPNVIYAQAASIAANSASGCGSAAGCQLGAWSSIDGGATWTFMTGSAGGSLRQCAGSGAGSSTAGSGDYGQNWYDQGLVVDPNNPDRVFFDTYDVWLATRTGTQWYDLSCAYSQTSQKVHADQHALVFAPGSSSILVIGNDGGMHGTTAANTAANDSVRPAFFNMDGGLNTIEYYAGDIAGDINGAGFATASQPRAAGGAQDNMDSVVLFSGTPTGPVQWTGTVGGDGFYARIDAKGGYVYVSNNSGQIHRCTGGNSCFTNPISWSSDVRATTMQSDTQSFVQPFDIFKGNPGGTGNAECGARCNHMIVGTYRVWETLASDGASITWTARTGDLTKNINAAVSYINEVAYAPATQTLGVAGTFDGNVQLLLGLGGTATTVNLTDSNNVLPNRPVTRVAFDPLSDNTAAHLVSVYATVAGFNANTPSQPGHVFRADCANVNCTSFTWTNKTGNLPDIPADSVLPNPNYPQQVFVGTEFGLYFTDDITQNPPTWYRFDNGIPHARIASLRTDRGNTTLSVWTGSRGAYVYPLPSGAANGSFGSLQGTVTDAVTNAPIVGATVTAQANSTTTDATGFYQFPSIGATTYNMAAQAAGYLQNSVSNVVVSANQTTTQNFKLASAPVTGCLTDTTQSDFDGGTKTNVDSASSPGDVKLTFAQAALDQSSTTLSFFQDSITSTAWLAQTFIPTVTGKLTQIQVQSALAAAGVTGTMTVEIRNTVSGSPGATVIGSANITNISGTTNAWYSANFTTPPDLNSGTQYAIVLRGVSGGPYRAVRGNNNSYANGAWFSSTNSGGSWGAAQTTDLAFQTFMSTGYASSGSLVSSLKDSNPGAGGFQRWTTINRTATAPANTTVTFQVAASNNANGPFNFVGPNNTNAASDVFANGASLSQFNGNRYLRYKAFFTTTNNSVTPTLSDVTVCYNNAPKQSQTINFPAIADQTYGNPDIVPGATASSGLPVSVNAIGNCSIVGGNIHITGAGSCTATATQGGDDFYLAASPVQQSFNIGKRNATWISNPNSKAYGDADPNPLTTGSGSGFLAADNVSATYSRVPGETVAAGPYHITAALSPASLSTNYNITNDGADFTINRKNATWTTNNNSKTYGTSDPAPITTGSGSGFLGSDNITATYTRDAGETVAGSPYHITATLSPVAALENYNVTNNGGTFTIGPAHLTVTADNQGKTYDGSGFTAFTAVISGFVNGDQSEVVSGSPGFTGGATTAVDAGSYTITPTIGTLAAANYDFTPFVNGTLTISKVHLSVSADGKSRVYGAANPPFTATLSGFVNSETDAGLRSSGKLTGTPTFSGTGPASTPTTTVGSYVITPAIGSLVATNYDFPAGNFVDGAFDITRAHLSVTADDKTRSYGAANPAFTATLAGFANGETDAGLRGSGGLSGYAEFSGTGPSSSATSDTGDYVITPAVGTLSATNYDFTPFVDGTLHITKAHLAVTAEDKSKNYDGGVYSPFTAILTGFVNGETDSGLRASGALSGAPGFSGNATTAVNAGSFTITPTQDTLSATNYDFTAFNNGTLRIYKVHLALTANDKSKTYNGAPYSPFTATISGFVNNETAVVVAGSPGFTGAAVSAVNAGSYTITPSQGSLNATNYDFTVFNGGTLAIYKVHLAVTADNKSKPYDGSPYSPFTATLSGFVNSETDAGLRAANALSGAAAYSGSAVGATGAATYTITPLQGTLAATNYDFTTFNDGTLTIGQVSLTVTADNKSRQYSDPNPALTYSVTGFVNGETDLVLSGAPGLNTAATPTSPVGAYTITITKGTLSASNYSFSFVNGILTVTKETASLLYTGDSLVATKSAGGKATVNLAALVTEEADGNLGNTLGGNSIKFSVYKSNNTPMTTADYTVTAVIDGTTRVATAPLANLPEDNYMVKLELIATNYSAELDNGVFTVVDPSTGAIGGGGWINDPEGGRGNFGFTSKFLKSGQSQGNNIYIQRKVMDLGAMGIVGAPSGARPYNVVFKSNAMSAMTTSATTTPKTGSFSGKTSIKAVDRTTGAMYNLSPTVNQSFQVDVTDNDGASAGTSPDMYAFRVWTSTGNYKVVGTYSAGGANTSQVPLQGGNVQVR